jgi:hypothetical protein
MPTNLTFAGVVQGALVGGSIPQEIATLQVYVACFCTVLQTAWNWRSVVYRRFREVGLENCS